MNAGTYEGPGFRDPPKDDDGNTALDLVPSRLAVEGSGFI